MFKITRNFVRTLKPKSKRYDVYQPRIHIAVHPTGRLTFAIAIKRNGNQSFRKVIGKYPNNTLDSHQISELQKRYRQWYLKLDDEPTSLPKDIDRREERAEERARDAAMDDDYSSGIVAELVADYLDRHASNLKTGDQQVHMLRPPTGLDGDTLEKCGGGILQTVWHTPVKLVSRKDLLRILRDIDAPVWANRVRSVIIKVFNFAVEHGYLDDSPATNLPKNKETRRFTVFSDEEIKTLWPLLTPMMRFLLATGARRSEVVTMRWSNISKNVWTQVDTKQGVPHSLVLTPWIMSLLPEKSSEWVWPSPFGGHITPAHPTKIFARDIRGKVGMEDKRLHDMRRTVATRIAELTGSAETADRVLGHVLGGVTGRYVVTDFRDLKRDALKLWSDRLEKLVDGEHDLRKVNYQP